MLEEARRYVDIGLPVIPLCAPDHVGEGLKHREICAYPGKVPVISDWQKRTMTTEDELWNWFSAHPNRNIGLPLGNASQLVGIDVDGELGESFLQDISKGDLPETWEFRTAKGRRLLYGIPDGVKVKKFKKAGDKEHQEVALLGDGQQTVIPPSVHNSGVPYVWVEGHSPFDMVEPALAPEWMLELMVSKRSGTARFRPTISPEEWTGIVPEGQRQDQLKRIVGSLIGRGTLTKAEVLLFSRAWNNEHCVPPWPDDELVTLVDNLTFAEISKGKQEMKVFRPSQLASDFLKSQSKLGYSWRYSIENGMYYCCDNSTGPWKILDSVVAAATVRKFLLQYNNSKWDAHHYVSEVLSALREQLALVTDSVLFDLGENPRTDIVSVRNGLLDWQDGNLMPWDPSCYLTLQLDVDYDPYATCPTWIQALEEWIPDPNTRLYLQEYIGLALIPDTSYRTAVFLYGGGSNGKSLFIEGISMIFGNTMNFTPLHKISDRFETAYLQNRLLNVCGDIDPHFLKDTGTLKAIIAGDRIHGEYKHGKSFSFTPVCRLLFSANVLPKSGDRSEAWYGRWGFIEFPHKFPANSVYKIQLETKLKLEKSGMLNWALEGLRRLKSQNKFTDSQTMLEAKYAYALENDNILSFLEEKIEYGPHIQGHLPRTYLYAYYKWYCELNRFRAVNIREFTKQLKGRGIELGSRPVKGDYKRRVYSFLHVKIKEHCEKEFNFMVHATGVDQD